MNVDGIELRNLTPTIGAEVLGVDLSKIDSGQLEKIRGALADNLVLFFRDQKMTP